MKTPAYLVPSLGLTLLVSLALSDSFAAPPSAPVIHSPKTKTLADLPLAARKVISHALRRDGVLAPEEIMEDAKLTASNGGYLGGRVAISGDTIVVGGFDEEASFETVYVFVKPAGGWGTGVESAKLIASDVEAGSNNGFGLSVAISGDTVVVGASRDDVGNNSDQGSAYIFLKPAGGWAGSITESAKLTASDGESSDSFGGFNEVAINGDTVVVGASGESIVDNMVGSAYVFVKPAGGWSGSLTENAKLTSSDGAPQDGFGRAVAVAGDTVVVGRPDEVVANFSGPGSVFVFLKPAGGWNGTRVESAKLTASDGESKALGYSVAIDGDTIVAGAPKSGLYGEREAYYGSAYVFLKPAGGWSGGVTESATLTASVPFLADFFGISVAIESDKIVVGAPSEGQEGDRGSGAAFLFNQPVGGWSGALTETDLFSSSASDRGDNFGIAVAVSGGTSVVGSQEDFIGAAYVFVGSPPMNRSLMADSDSPMFTPDGSFADKTIALEELPAEGLLHLEGGATITPDGSNQAQITVTGSYVALAGDVFSLAYSFSVDLNTAAPASYALAGSVTVDGVPVPFSAEGTLLPGLHKYEGTAQALPFPADAAGDFSATLTVNFGSNAAPLSAEPGTLVLAIQQLDFQLGPDPATVQAPSQSQNISTRADVGTGDHVLIGGFIVDGTDPKLVVLRAIGPSLADFGVTGVLADPVLELHDSTGATVATNDNWMDLNADDQTTLTDNLLAPTNDLESALVMTLDPGAYTAIVSGAGATTGVALVEAYDLDNGATDSRLANISTRGFVATADSVMIGGFIIGAGGGGFSGVIVRGLGPSLSGSGVPDALADPTLEVHNGNGDLIDSNDNWMSDPNMQSVIDNNLAPSDPNEAALFEILPPGLYTAILAGAGDSTGVGLVETYDID